MGEAKQKRKRKKTFLKQHPYCCYCGGHTLADTIDHVPSIQMFTHRRRPKGLEVPACYACNQATKRHEQVAAMLGRIYPDASTTAEDEEVGKIMKAVGTNVPHLLEEMAPSPSQRERFAKANVNLPNIGGILNASGPLLNRSIQVFGAKLGYALYYDSTERVIPLSGGVAVRWFSNFDAVTGRIPSEFLRVLGPETTLEQGKWGVGDQFSYSFAITDNSEMAVYFSTFRKSFAVVSWASDDVSRFEGAVDIQVHRPGQL